MTYAFLILLAFTVPIHVAHASKLTLRTGAKIINFLGGWSFAKDSMTYAFLILLASTVPIHAIEDLPRLERQIRHDIQMLCFPPAWKKNVSDEQHILDVAVVGGGMAGMTAGFALIKEGIKHIKIYDQNPLGLAGPWKKYARMRHLRSSKTVMGPALGIPNLTFHAWYVASFSEMAWEQLKFIHTECWNDYLMWFGQVLDLPLEHEMVLQSIRPLQDCFEMVFNRNGEKLCVYARKIVLATGREGFGGEEIPAFMRQVPKRFYAHTCESIEPSSFSGRNIIVIGAGASAFDVAGVALENGASHVSVILRRSTLPLVNKFSKFSFPGIQQGFYYLTDEMRCALFAEAYEWGSPPPQGAVERIKDSNRFSIHYNTHIQQVVSEGNVVVLKTSQGDFSADYIVLGTGFAVEGYQRPELCGIIDDILLWQSHVPEELLKAMPKLGRFPYLGDHFQFLEKVPGQAAYLKHIYCFNYGAFLSHGLLSGDIPGISIGATRLANGIARDFFLEEAELYQQVIRNYNIPLFDIKEYPILSP